jgi:hypothetical protein
MKDWAPAAWPNVKRGERDRQPEASRSGAARVQIKYAACRFDRRLVRVTRTDLYALLAWINAKCLKIAELSVNAMKDTELCSQGQ